MEVKQELNTQKKHPLTNVQKKLYMHHQFYPHDPSYNLSYCYKIEGNIHLERFVRIWEMIFGSAGVFKVHFENQAGVPLQVYDTLRKVKLDIEYLPKPMTMEQCDQHVMQHITNLSRTIVNLEQWPLSHFKAFYSEDLSYFTMNFPHIIFDGYSGYQLFNEFSRLYNSDKNLDEIAKELHENVNEESYFHLTNKETGPLNNRALTYFREELAGLESLHIKELEQKRDIYGRLVGQEMNFDLPSDLSKQIESYIESNNLSDFSFFLSVYFIMIHKLFSKTKMVVGIPLANRSKENKKIFGYFVNSLPMAIDFQDLDSFQELCHAIKRKTISLIRYQNVDLSAHIHQILPGKIHEAADKFNNLFTYYSQKLSFDLDQCKVTQMPVQAHYLNFPLSSSVERMGDTYRVIIQYGSYLKHADLKSLFTAMIKSILSEKNQKISNIRMMEEREEKVLQQLLKPGVRFPISNTIHDTFMEQVLKSPQQIAVKYGEEQWTYKQLDELSNQISHFIHKKFPKQATKVAVSLHRSPVLIALILGILKSGRAYVPIDPIMPAERLHYILSDLNHPPCIIHTSLIKKIQQMDNAYGWEEIESEIVSMPKSCLDLDLDPEQAAYVIYTSGSTGKPKGVMVSHYNVLRSFKASEKDFRFHNEDIWVLYHSYGFDPSVWEIFGALLFGGKLVVVDELTRKAPDEMYRLLLDEKVTVLQMTPSAFRQLITEVQRQEQPETLSLRCIILGGETLHFHMLKPWIDIYGDKNPRLFNVYGPTETTILATYYPITSNDLNSSNCSIIGRPLTDVELYVKNRYMENLPVGVPGELYIGGEGVSNGYYNREDLTKERFLQGISERGKVYRTGDEVRILPDGTLEFMERIDQQIQLRGYRVELGEIEFTLQQHPHCKDSVVTVHTFKEEDKRLVAYVVLDNGHKLDERNLQAYLRKKLPEYMVPSIFLEIPYKPMTVNGKVDYNALPEPSLVQYTDSPEDGSIKGKIITVWKQVLKTDHVNDHDNFFDIGGTSMLVSEVYYKLIDTFQFKTLSMVDLFQYTTPQSLAKYLSQLDEPSLPEDEAQQSNKRKAAMQRRRLAAKK